MEKIRKLKNNLVQFENYYNAQSNDKSSLLTKYETEKGVNDITIFKEIEKDLLAYETNFEEIYQKQIATEFNLFVEKAQTYFNNKDYENTTLYLNKALDFRNNNSDIAIDTTVYHSLKVQNESQIKYNELVADATAYIVYLEFYFKACPENVDNLNSWNKAKLQTYYGDDYVNFNKDKTYQSAHFQYFPSSSLNYETIYIGNKPYKAVVYNSKTEDIYNSFRYVVDNYKDKVNNTTDMNERLALVYDFNLLLDGYHKLTSLDEKALKDYNKQLKKAGNSIENIKLVLN